jgi:peroxisomal 3,2-trans-enoyl-CoA isomerase
MQRFAQLTRLIAAKNVGLATSNYHLQSVSSIRFYSSSNHFEDHVKLVTQLKDEPSNEDKLKLYALFKQATEGPNQKSKPGALDFVGKYKWQAWTDLGQMAQFEAQKAYVQKVQELIQSIGLTSTGSETSQPAASSGANEPELVVNVEKSVKTIRFNRPNKKNAFTPDMYIRITKELNQASKDKSIKAVILTGTG